MNRVAESEAQLVLAAEDCEAGAFDHLHKFPSRSDRRVIGTLVAHGPVLLRGGRGSGKSAFMIAASRQLDPVVPSSSAVGLYLSLRNAPLLKSTGEAYGRILCEIIIRKVQDELGVRAKDFNPGPEVDSLQYALSRLAQKLGKRIVLYLDDAAHLGREASLEEFFDIYRTLSSSLVSCKATIYPGVTRFGVRFDVYNDATVVDLLRSEELPEFEETFVEVMEARYPDAFAESVFSSSIDRRAVAGFLGQASLGNMRGFVFGCNALKDRCCDGRKIGIPELSETLIELSSNYYWPLLAEIRPKLGKYEPMVKVAQEVAEKLFEDCGLRAKNPRDVIVHRDFDERLAKPLQILEYAGFIAKREASRAMKSGGRGARYALNLCNLLEQTPRSRLTRTLFDEWADRSRVEAVQFNRNSWLSDVQLPPVPETDELAIFDEKIEKLERSTAYPYGLTHQKIDVLGKAGFKTVGDLVNASDEQLDEVWSVGEAAIRKIRNVLGQAIWM